MFVNASEFIVVLASTMFVTVPVAATPVAEKVTSFPEAALSGFQFAEFDHSWSAPPLSQLIAAACRVVPEPMLASSAANNVREAGVCRVL